MNQSVTTSVVTLKPWKELTMATLKYLKDIPPYSPNPNRLRYLEDDQYRKMSGITRVGRGMISPQSMTPSEMLSEEAGTPDVPQQNSVPSQP